MVRQAQPQIPPDPARRDALQRKTCRQVLTSAVAMILAGVGPKGVHEILVPHICYGCVKPESLNPSLKPPKQNPKIPNPKIGRLSSGLGVDNFRVHNFRVQGLGFRCRAVRSGSGCQSFLLRVQSSQALWLRLGSSAQMGRADPISVHVPT